MMESPSELQKMYDEHAKMKKALTEIVELKDNDKEDLLTLAMNMVEIAEEALK